MTKEEIVRALRGYHNSSGIGTPGIWEHSIFGAASLIIESLTAENARLTTERDTAQRRERAAVEDLNLTANCDVCKHYDADEISCAKPTVDSYSCFEWRGPQEAWKGE